MREPLDPAGQTSSPTGGCEQGAENLPVLVGSAQAARQEPVSTSPEARAAGAMIPTAQAVAVAAGSFVAGAAVVGLAGRRKRRSQALAARRAPKGLARRARRAHSAQSPKALQMVQIVGTRSLLLDVHLLGGAGER